MSDRQTGPTMLQADGLARLRTHLQQHNTICRAWGEPFSVFVQRIADTYDGIAYDVAAKELAAFR